MQSDLYTKSMCSFSVFVFNEMGDDRAPNIGKTCLSHFILVPIRFRPLS